eukprot:5865841-Amphidinium_carterae.1
MTIEIFQNAQKKYDVNNPPTQNRFFVFLLQHHRERFQNLFLRAGASVRKATIRRLITLTNEEDHTSTDQIDEIYKRYDLRHNHQKNASDLYSTFNDYQR